MCGEWAEEMGWLIEDGGGLCLGLNCGNPAWVTFTNPTAIRFSRQQDADNFLIAIRNMKFGESFNKCKSVEHMWSGPASERDRAEEPRKPIMIVDFTYPDAVPIEINRKKPVAELTPADIPRGMELEDLATDAELGTPSQRNERKEVSRLLTESAEVARIAMENRLKER